MHSFLKVKPQLNFRKHFKFVLLSFVWLALCTAAIFGQSGRDPTRVGEDSSDIELIRVRTDEVIVPVSIRGPLGTPVSGLKPDDFHIFDNGVRQEIASFNRQRIPANIVLLLDASGSVFSRMRFIREAAKQFLKSLLPEDKVCVMQFADNVELLQDWTAGDNPKPLLKALDWRYHPGEATAFYDGVYLAAQDQLKNIEGRKIIILLTDGIDTAKRKRSSFSDALTATQRSEATVYVVSLTESLRVQVAKHDRGWLGSVFGGASAKQIAHANTLINDAERVLEKLATTTGGRMFLPVSEADLVPAYESIAEELRMQYVITFKPKKRAAAGEYRRLRVLVAPGQYEVAAREGYVGRS